MDMKSLWIAFTIEQGHYFQGALVRMDGNGTALWIHRGDLTIVCGPTVLVSKIQRESGMKLSSVGAE